jgi:hypothetical protein
MLFNQGRSAARISALIAVFAGLILTSQAYAQQAKVIKIQGKKAIVQFPDDARPHVGQLIDLGAGGPVSMSNSGGGSHSTGTRSMIIGGSGELSSLTSPGVSTSTTSFGLDGRYGWNAGVMEYGAIATLVYSSTSGGSARTLSAGGFFDYNLVPNTPGTEIVYGGAALGRFGTKGTTVGTAETTGTVMDLEIGGQVKWFPLATSVAVRGDLLYRIESASDTIKSSVTGSGLVAKVGFYIYY